MILWKVHGVEVLYSFRGGSYLGIKVRMKGLIYYIVNVYSACCISLKRTLWCKLLYLKLIFTEGEWIIRGFQFY